MKALMVTAVGIAIAAMSLAPSGAWAKPTTLEQPKVEALAEQIEAALKDLGCTASFRDDKAAIQAVIANSGLKPELVEEALAMVQAHGGLCGDQAAAEASIVNTLEFALSKYPGAPAGGPPGQRGIPIGGPPAFFSGPDYASR